MKCVYLINNLTFFFVFVEGLPVINTLNSENVANITYEILIKTKMDFVWPLD